jgi:hypothetical protein
MKTTTGEAGTQVSRCRLRGDTAGVAARKHEQCIGRNAWADRSLMQRCVRRRLQCAVAVFRAMPKVQRHLIATTFIVQLPCVGVPFSDLGGSER